MSGTYTFPGTPMETINLFSLRTFSSCPETRGTLAASHWQLPKLTASSDVLTFLQPIGEQQRVSLLALEIARPNRCTQAPFILT